MVGIKSTSTKWWLVGLASAGVVGSYFPTALGYIQRPVDFVVDKVVSLSSGLGLNLEGFGGDDDDDGTTSLDDMEDLGGDIADLFNSDNFA